MESHEVGLRYAGKVEDVFEEGGKARRKRVSRLLVGAGPSFMQCLIFTTLHTHHQLSTTA